MRPASSLRRSPKPGHPQRLKTGTTSQVVTARHHNGASMEGRAIARPNLAQRAITEAIRDASMEGRAIARPNGRCPHLAHDDLWASMEGRAIARPNRSLDLGWLTCPFAGVCERSRKRELRRCLDSVVKLRFALCHKGSSGPQDLRAHHSARIR